MITIITVYEYLDERGRSPFRDWLDAVDKATRARIHTRIWRFETGNLGDHRHVGGGVWEARLDFGPGYRVYFGKQGVDVILLLVGGDKSTQTQDIERAQERWAAHVKEKRDGKAK
jgi:putative addiction module killer protein